MAGWTVMVPRAGAMPEEAVFVRDGFNWAAAVFGPFWALVNRMWIVAIILGVAGILAGFLPPVLAVVANTGLLLVAGIFAADLKVWSLARRGYAEETRLIAYSSEEAELRFFADRRIEPPQAVPVPKPAFAAGTLSDADPLGLFGKGW